MAVTALIFSPVKWDVLIIEGASSSRLAYLCVSDFSLECCKSSPDITSSCGTALFSDGEFFQKRWSVHFKKRLLIEQRLRKRCHLGWWASWRSFSTSNHITHFYRAVNTRELEPLSLIGWSQLLSSPYPHLWLQARRTQLWNNSPKRGICRDSSWNGHFRFVNSTL